MIRFKVAAATAVPVPPEGYVTLFIDQESGLPAAKTHDGNVVQLKGEPGTGVPEGGTIGQVVTMTGDGPGWQDVAPGGEPAGDWINLLPPDGELRGPYGELIEGDLVRNIAMESITVDASRSGFFNRIVRRVRVTANIEIDARRVDPEAPIASNIFAVAIGDHAYARFDEGASTVSIEVPMVGDAAFQADGLTVRVELLLDADEPNLESAVARLTLTQLDLLVTEADVAIETDALIKEEVALVGRSLGSGGIALHPDDNPALVAATSVEVTGYYTPAYLDPPNFPPAAGSEVFLGLYELQEIADLPLTTGNPGPGTVVWWRAYNEEELPVAGPILLRVSIDGAAPVLAAAYYFFGE